MTIKRIWHGYTTGERADEYHALLKREMAGDVEAIPGLRTFEVLRRGLPNDVEFVTIMEFDDLASVKAVFGEDHSEAIVPDEARRILARFDRRARHYEVEEKRVYEPAIEPKTTDYAIEAVEPAVAGAVYAESATADYAENTATEPVDERYEAAPVIDAVPVVEPAEESLVSEEPVIAPQPEPAVAAPEKATPEQPAPLLAPDKWFVRKDKGNGAVPATREGYRVVARFIFGMLIFGLIAVAMAAVGPEWLRPAALAVFVLGSLAAAGYFVISARRHTDQTVTFSEYRRYVREQRAAQHTPNYEQAAEPR